MTDTEIEGLLDRLTLEEQVSLLAGADVWTTVAIPRVGIPAIKVSDGPNGARGGGTLFGGVKAACFPCGIALGASWNPALVEEIGSALAEEARSKGARMLLAPTVNIDRSGLNGRNFECYSEDPRLTADLAVAYVGGLQRKGVAATIKHFAGNESEFERVSMNSEIDERTLREIYLPPFEAAVKRAGVWAVMSSYNRLNGPFAAESRRLLTEILRDEWGFDGIVMSDWFGSHTTAATVNAGLDLEMPGPTRDRGEKLVAAGKAGEGSAATVRASAHRILKLIDRLRAFANPATGEEQAIDRPEHRALIRRAGAEAAVLLKNDGILPLKADKALTLAVIGPNAKEARIMGGGSAQLNAHYRVSPFEGIAAALGGAEPGFAIGCTNYRLMPLLRQPVQIDYFAGGGLAGPVAHHDDSAEGEVMWFPQFAPGLDSDHFSARLSTRFTPETSGSYRFGLVSAGRSRLFVDGRPVVDAWSDWRPGSNLFGEACDEVTGDAELEAGRSYAITVEFAAVAPRALGVRAVRIGVARPIGEAEIAAAVRLAAAADVAVLCVGRNGEWDAEGLDLPGLALPGRQDELIARVAAANRRTVVVLQSGGPVAMPWLDQVSAVLQAWYPGQECGNAIADVLFGQADPGGRLAQTFPVRIEDNPTFGDPTHYPGKDGRVVYAEGVFVGYRHYDKKGIAPLFPFGHGLSYTAFRYENLRLSPAGLEPGGQLTATVEVTNIGARRGSEVVQFYVRDTVASLARPEKELKAFAKIALRPGERQTVTRSFDMRALAFFDATRHAWVAEAGEFEILVGSSSRDIRARAGFSLAAEAVVNTGA